MRILQATDCYPPPLMGGRDLHVRMLAHELADRGHQVQVVSLAGPEGAHTEMDDGIQVHRISGWSRALSRFYVDPQKPFHPTMPDPGIVSSLADLIKQFRPEIVHVHSWILHSFLPILPTAETRVVVTMHEYGMVCPKNTYVHQGSVCDGPRFAKCVSCASGQYGAVRAMALTTGMVATRRSLSRVDRYIAVSSAVARASSSVPVLSQRPIDVIPPFVADDNFAPINVTRPKFVPSTGDFVMFAGSLTPHKGIDVLLDAWSGIDHAVPLVLAGLVGHDTPPQFPQNVTVAENVPHEEVLRAWMYCSVAVVPSLWPEPFGLVALEAMAAGRPVVASAEGGLIDLVRDGTTGTLVRSGDVSALRVGIQKLLANPELRSAMGLAGRERATNYAAKVVVPQIERVYEEVVASSPPPSPAWVWRVFQ
jgi:glycosyltransferase involved in cell wall biosynthesis